MTQQERIMSLAQERIACIGQGGIRQWGKSFKTGFDIAVKFTLENLWISVKEELPKKTQECFVKCCIGNEQFNYTSVFDSHTQRFDDSINDEVTHWMPIPKLQEGGEK